MQPMAAEDEPRAGAGAGAGAGQAGPDQPSPSAAGLAGPGALAGVSRTGVLADCWSPLRALTPARLALGRAGASMPTIEVLRFGWDHAQARDAVQRQLDVHALARDVASIGFQTRRVTSRAPDRA